MKKPTSPDANPTQTAYHIGLKFTREQRFRAALYACQILFGQPTWLLASSPDLRQRLIRSPGGHSREMPSSMVWISVLEAPVVKASECAHEPPPPCALDQSPPETVHDTSIPVYPVTVPVVEQSP